MFHLQSLEYSEKHVSKNYWDSESDHGFQDFVGELFETCKMITDVYPTKGNDGGIDMYLDQGEYQTFYETKFVKSKSKLRNSITTLSADLKTHLVTSPNPSGLYAPWFQAEKPIRNYVIIVSCEIATQQLRRLLEAQVTSILREAYQNNNQLRHLDETKVTLLSWRFLRLKLIRASGVLFRVFHSIFPVGLKPFEAVSPNANGFRAYLSTTKLPYFSPLRFKSLNGGSAIKSPSEILVDLVTSSDAGMILQGKGGIGKTRLCEEVANLASISDNWTVLRATASLDSNSLAKARELFSAGSSYLIIFDYVESHKNTFTKLVNIISDWRDIHSINIYILGNCRPSNRSIVGAVAAKLKTIDLDRVSGSQQTSYQDWVTTQIIQTFQDNETWPKAEKICKGIPVIATFLHYVRSKLGTSELNSLLDTKTFQTWLHERLLSFAHDEKDRTAARDDLAVISAVFPVSSSVYKTLYKRYGTVLDFLVRDGWIYLDENSESQSWNFSHDIIADGIFLDHLLGKGQNAGIFLGQLLATASEIGKTDCLLWTLHRIGDDLLQRNCDLSNSLEQWFLQPDQEDQLSRFRIDILENRALTLDRRKLLICNSKVINNVGRNIYFHGIIAAWAVEYQRTSHRLALPLEIVDLISGCLKKSSSSVKLISLAYRIGEPSADVAALALISDRTVSLNRKSDILAKMLANGIPFEKIESPISAWLTHNGKQRHAARLISICFLNRHKSARALALQTFPDWLSHNPDDPAARYVVRSALTLVNKDIDRKSKLQLVTHHLVVSRLTSKPNQIVDRFIIEPWLSLAGRKALSQVQEVKKIEEWIKVFGSTKFAFSVLGPWLWSTKSSGFHHFREEARAWLISHRNHECAQFVICGWLRACASGIRSCKDDEACATPWREEAWTIEENLKEWTKSNFGSGAIAYVARRWIDVAGRAGAPIVEDSLFCWLKRLEWPSVDSRQSADVSQVLGSWIRAGLPLSNEIWTALEYIFHFEPCEREIGIVLKALCRRFREETTLSSRQDLISLTEPIVEEWTNNNMDSFFGYVVAEWLKLTGERGFRQLSQKIDQWMNSDQSDSDIAYVVSASLEAAGIEAYLQFESWIEEQLDANGIGRSSGYLIRGGLRGGLRQKFSHSAGEWVKGQDYVEMKVGSSQELSKLMEEIQILLDST